MADKLSEWDIQEVISPFPDILIMSVSVIKFANRDFLKLDRAIVALTCHNNLKDPDADQVSFFLAQAHIDAPALVNPIVYLNPSMTFSLLQPLQDIHFSIYHLHAHKQNVISMIEKVGGKLVCLRSTMWLD
ncbi:uncharacterized protein F5891DRAFT_1188940 [Suillus fuscotomentosus]|uniref:Uncharacterized protein n=1 Tax=Suillus fuscotomentosus TaxID=1912939 RepID=A0AAD4HJS1_9AGAM|nr:uncharacterized protein F5891DRAFT_1188940 [Suillus fuscotomentosus]KAG1900240.1 hypothetical protein F5891DRAFT_1188940 [Suillus fuscotomentosus]